MLRLLLPLLFASLANAQFVYDFNSLAGSDTHPFTLLDGQDNWTEETFNTNNRCGVTASLSHDGTPALRFQESGPGFGCDASRINDSNWLFPPFAGIERTASFEVDIKVGFWGGSFGLAHDTNGDGVIRGSQAGERGVRFMIGSQANQQLRLYAADQTFAQVPLSGLGISGGHWVRVRVIMDLVADGGAGRGSLFVMNITQGATDFTAVAGLQEIPLALDPAALDATNPIFWDAVWLHFEGATYELDNIDIGRRGFTRSYGTACNGTAGPVTLTATGTLEPLSTLTLESDNHEASAIGATIVGFSDADQQGIPLPLLLDPFLGTNGCSLHCAIFGTVSGTTSGTAPATLTQNLNMPHIIWSGITFYVQHVCFESVPGGLSFSNGVLVQLP